MESFAQDISSFVVPKDNVGVFWLGQAGFIFKTSENYLIAVDIYLSDCCDRYFGFKRMIAKLLQPYDLTFDLLLSSHAHYDHFDIDAVPMLMDNGITQLIAARDVEVECRRLNLKDRITYLSVGDAVNRYGVDIKAVACDHGKDTPDALGFFLNLSGKKVYLMGDTCYRPDLLTNPELKNVDLLILPINGAFGNLNEEQAVEVVKVLQPKLTIPCHYGNFAEHGGSPQLFMKYAKSAKIAYRIMRQGEGIRI
jgi:L-ascorbate 6-phosphate lactonase